MKYVYELPSSPPPPSSSHALVPSFFNVLDCLQAYDLNRLFLIDYSLLMLYDCRVAMCSGELFRKLTGSLVKKT